MRNDSGSDLGSCGLLNTQLLSMLERSGVAEREIEPTVPCLSVERSHVVGVPIKLVRNERRDSLEECCLTTSSSTAPVESSSSDVTATGNPLKFQQVLAGEEVAFAL